MTNEFIEGLMKVQDASIKLHRSQDQPTSIMAAQQIVPLISEFKKRVVAYAMSMGFKGFCDAEMNQFFGEIGSSYRTRRAELTREGLIVNSGRTRTYGSNRQHIIWVHKDFK
jgi:hypothetical protein